METVFYYTGMIIWIGLGGLGTITLLLYAGYALVDLIVRQIGYYDVLVEAIWSITKKKYKKEE